MTQPPPNERRRDTRFLACFPGSVVPKDGIERPSLIKDLSVRGALLLVYSSKISVGDPVELHLYLTPECKEYRVAEGHVVRVERLAPEETGPWSRRVGIEFEAPLTEHEEEIVALRTQLGIES